MQNKKISGIIIEKEGEVMPTIHISAKKEDIKKIVLMPGDPLRAKYIAEKFLEDFYQVNHTRGMLAYTGKYKGKEITVFAHGMGCPSIGIYAYELFHFYDVDTIIRIGTSGANTKELDLLDIVIADASYCYSNFPKLFFEDDAFLFPASNTLNDQIEELAKEKNISYQRGKIITGDIFDVYIDDKKRLSSLYEKAEGALAVEMEAAALFALAKHLGKRATCLLSVVDSPYKTQEVSSKERETALDDMIKLALDTAHNL